MKKQFVITQYEYAPGREANAMLEADDFRIASGSHKIVCHGQFDKIDQMFYGKDASVWSVFGDRSANRVQ